MGGLCCDENDNDDNVATVAVDDGDGNGDSDTDDFVNNNFLLFIQVMM